MSWFILGLKGQGHVSQKRIDLQKERNTDICCSVFPASYLCSDATDCRFSMHGVFRSQPAPA